MLEGATVAMNSRRTLHCLKSSLAEVYGKLIPSIQFRFRNSILLFEYSLIALAPLFLVLFLEYLFHLVSNACEVHPSPNDDSDAISAEGANEEIKNGEEDEEEDEPVSHLAH